MAKIALITDSFSPLVESLALALSYQKQDVVVVTSKSVAEKIPQGITVLAPFKRWSALEAVRALPVLVAQNFDVWHFLFATPESKPFAAHWVLASMARSLPRKVVAGSFASPRNVKGWDSRFVGLLDLALFSNRSFLMKMKRRRQVPKHTLAEVLPPLEGVAVQTDSKVRDETHRLLNGLRPFLVLPDLRDGPEWLENSPIDFVVLKPHPRRGSAHRHVFYTGEVSPAERDLLISKSLAICLLYGDYSVLELQRFHQWSEQAERPLIVREHQTLVWPGLCWHLKSGWVLEDAGEPLRPLLIENPDLQLPHGFTTYSRRELVDSTLNELLRLYQRSFAQRWA